MEKPRKMIHGDNCNQPWCRCEDVNKMHTAMSTWLEGEVPTVDNLITIMRDHSNLDGSLDPILFEDVAQAIHAILTRKLTGKV